MSFGIASNRHADIAAASRVILPALVECPLIVHISPDPSTEVSVREVRPVDVPDIELC